MGRVKSQTWQKKTESSSLLSQLITATLKNTKKPNAMQASTNLLHHRSDSFLADTFTLIDSRDNCESAQEVMEPQVVFAGELYRSAAGKPESVRRHNMPVTGGASALIIVECLGARRLWQEGKGNSNFVVDGCCIR